MKSILLIGINNFGTMITRRLHDLGHQVLAVDRDEGRINAILPFVTDAQIGEIGRASCRERVYVLV
jgi:trk system potassium uptake protein TrkA